MPFCTSLSSCVQYFSPHFLASLYCQESRASLPTRQNRQLPHNSKMIFWEFVQMDTIWLAEATQGCVLSLLLFTLYTFNCSP